MKKVKDKIKSLKLRKSKAKFRKTRVDFSEGHKKGAKTAKVFVKSELFSKL